MRKKPSVGVPVESGIRSKGSVSFGFKYLEDASYTDSRKAEFFIRFIQRLRKLCTIDWNTIIVSGRHSFGYEKINVSQLKRTSPVLHGMEKVTVFRATGDNHAFLGFRDGYVFQVVFIEAEFGDIYNHG